MERFAGLVIVTFERIPETAAISHLGDNTTQPSSHTSLMVQTLVDLLRNLENRFGNFRVVSYSGD